MVRCESVSVLCVCCGAKAEKGHTSTRTNPTLYSRVELYGFTVRGMPTLRAVRGVAKRRIGIWEPSSAARWASMEKSNTAAADARAKREQRMAQLHRERMLVAPPKQVGNKRELPLPRAAVDQATEAYNKVQAQIEAAAREVEAAREKERRRKNAEEKKRLAAIKREEEDLRAKEAQRQAEEQARRQADELAKRQAEEEAEAETEEEAAEREAKRQAELEARREAELEAKREAERADRAERIERIERAEKAAAADAARRARATARKAARQKWLDEEERKKAVFGRHGEFGALDRLRASSLPQTAFLRFLIVEENRQVAEKAREESYDLLDVKDENAAIWAAIGKQRVQECKVQQKRTRKAKKAMLERSRDQVMAARKVQKAARKMLKRRAEATRRDMHAHVREAKYVEAKAAEAKHAAAEETKALLLREHGAKRRKEVAKAVASVRERLQRDKKEVASQIRASMPSSSSGNGDVAEHRCRLSINHPKVVSVAQSRADQMRYDAKLWRRQHRKEVESYIEEARLTREWTQEQRLYVKEAREDALEDRKMAAEELRITNKQIARRKAKAQPRPGSASSAYKSRYASKEAARMFDSSGWMKLTSWFKMQEPAARAARLGYQPPPPPRLASPKSPSVPKLKIPPPLAYV